MSIEFKVEDGVAVITLNRPDKKNAMLLAMRDQLAELCERVNDDSAIRVAILTGAGTDFCAGADVSEMAKGGIDGSLFRARHMHKAITALGRVQKPLIGAVRGVALGMGLSMALACDVLLATETLRIGCVQRKIGLSPDAGNVWFLTRYLGVARARELVFSARMVGAQEAAALGLVGRLVADAQLMDEAMAAARSFADGPTLALGAAKRMFDRASALSLDEFMDLEGTVVPLVAQSEDFREGTRAFLEKRPPKFVGN
ncbi:MAG TPA: enoyl-CoA hydratase-related protein [Nevskia sp.]|nr:enoyl-CoA hydratase-related protein [Nevskia sp.]